ncbi:MAG TPA: c-type cytochrome [Polyangiaceae bacterium]
MTARLFLVLAALGLAAGCAGSGGGGERSAGPRDRGEVAPGKDRTRDVPKDPVARGRYLVAHVAACGDCHSPHGKSGAPDAEDWLAGLDCFVDVAPGDPETGCLATANLTNHETGLANRSDGEIKDMFLKGERPDGRALHPFMPYPFLANLSDADADAIVVYLRTVPGVDHTVRPSQAPFFAPPRPAPRVPDAAIPSPRPDYPERAAALRGRYLAGSVGTCMNCHTPRGAGGIALERAFQGGMKFERRGLGLPSGYPELVYSSNLTPHATGIAAYTVEKLVRAVKHGEDGNQGGAELCPPMPAGPGGSFGGLTDADATDIAHYLLSLEPAEHAIPDDCRYVAPAASAASSDHARILATIARAERDGSELRLSELGLYADIAAKRVAPGWVAFEPAYPLYADGADKRRWLRLPPRERIDASDPDHLRFPRGTLLFKEFSRAGRRLETRVLARTGPDAGDVFMAAFVWNDDESDARLARDGAPNVRGTSHDVPSSARCSSCHRGEPGRVLGVSAVQTPKLASELSGAPLANFGSAPGDPPVRAALGYLHGNCGHCHNPNGSARPDTDLNLRLSSRDETPEETGAYRTALGRALVSFRAPGYRVRVAPGEPERSALVHRMRALEAPAQMPPLGAETQDAAGVELVERWIGSL